MANRFQWLDLVRHGIRGFKRYLLVLQHHDIPAGAIDMIVYGYPVGRPI